jgi:DHA2 family methylenomycin A resistance protein-like MFS transporter
VGAGSTSSGRLTARFGPRLPMLVGMSCGAAGTLAMSAAGPGSPLVLLLGGSVVLGLCSLAMPAMTSVALGAVEPDRAGLASGVLNAARQTGGALGVALLGALFASSAAATGEPGLDVPLRVAALGYVVAVGLSWLAGRR